MQKVFFMHEKTDNNFKRCFLFLLGDFKGEETLS